MVGGGEVKYVPKVELRERIIRTSKPEIKWIDKFIEVPQVKEVVRYIESDRNVETVIRYVPKGKPGTEGPAGTAEEVVARELPLREPAGRMRLEEYEAYTTIEPQQPRQGRDILTPRITVPLTVSYLIISSLCHL